MGQREREGERDKINGSEGEKVRKRGREKGERHRQRDLFQRLKRTRRPCTKTSEDASVNENRKNTTHRFPNKPFVFFIPQQNRV